jgi:hypothetical protein
LQTTKTPPSQASNCHQGDQAGRLCLHDNRPGCPRKAPRQHHRSTGGLVHRLDMTTLHALVTLHVV